MQSRGMGVGAALWYGRVIERLGHALHRPLTFFCHSLPGAVMHSITIETFRCFGEKQTARLAAPGEGEQHRQNLLPRPAQGAGRPCP